jgi:hypothetical protein
MMEKDRCQIYSSPKTQANRRRCMLSDSFAQRWRVAGTTVETISQGGATGSNHERGTTKTLVRIQGGG